MVVSNVTDYAWRLSVRNTVDGTVRNVAVTPRGVCTIELAGGDYEIEQTAEAAALTRRISCRFESAQTYQWQLATLLAPGTAGPP